MPTTLFELGDRIVADDGRVIAKYELLLKKALSDEVFSDTPALFHEDIKKYNEVRPDNKVAFWEDDGNFTGADPETHNWTVPEEYEELDIVEMTNRLAAGRGLTGEEYQDRLRHELGEMDKRDMFPFVRCLLYVTDTFKKKGVVWGVGRGSSCASLVMYVLGVNRIDPVKYNIAPEEFYK